VSKTTCFNAKSTENQCKLFGGNSSKSTEIAETGLKYLKKLLKKFKNRVDNLLP
jgi:hypothetical protein